MALKRFTSRFKIEYTHVAKVEMDEKPMVAVQHRAAGPDGQAHTSEWLYMTPTEARKLAQLLQDASGGEDGNG